MDEAHRGRGVGTTLVRLLLAEHLSDVEEVLLGCTEENVPFSARLGFQLARHPYLKRVQEAG